MRTRKHFVKSIPTREMLNAKWVKKVLLKFEVTHFAFSIFTREMRNAKCKKNAKMWGGV